MKINRPFAFSILLNFILLGFISVLFVRRASTPAQPSLSLAQSTAEETAEPPSQQPIAPFSWSQLESTDYSVYIANLRAIGCPEQTVGDIIRADVASQNLPMEQKNGLIGQLLVQQPMNSSPKTANTSPGFSRALSPEHSTRSFGSYRSRADNSDNGAAGSNIPITSPTRANTAGTRFAGFGPSMQGPSASKQPVNSTAPGAVQAPGLPAADQLAGPNAQTHPGQQTRGGLTLEEQIFRAKYGWKAYNDAQRQGLTGN